MRWLSKYDSREGYASAAGALAHGGDVKEILQVRLDDALFLCSYIVYLKKKNILNINTLIKQVIYAQ